MKKFTYILLVLALLTGVSISLKKTSADTPDPVAVTENTGLETSAEEINDTLVDMDSDIEIGADADEAIEAINVVEENPEETSDEEETIIHE